MSKKTETVKGDLADPQATAPSNNPNPPETSTAAEPNSTQRVGKKVTRTGQGNGGGEGDPRGRPGTGNSFTPDTLGEREAVPAAEHDVVWTNESKDRWDSGQPDFAKLLEQRNKIASGELGKEPEKTDD